MPVPSARSACRFPDGQHFVETSALDVEDLTAQGQNRLELSVASLFGGTTSGITLHQEDFSYVGVARLTVRQFAGQELMSNAALLARQFPRAGAPLLAPRPPRTTFCTIGALPADVLRTSAAISSFTMLSTTGRTSEETSLSLVWDENFGSGTLTESTQVNLRAHRRPST